MAFCLFVSLNIVAMRRFVISRESVGRGFLFLWVLGMGYVILLWHSLSLPYNYLSLICQKRFWMVLAVDDDEKLASL